MYDYSSTGCDESTEDVGPELVTVTDMGGSCAGHGGHVHPRFFEANVKSLIFIIGAPPD